jgi:hypothetical protein
MTLLFASSAPSARPDNVLPALTMLSLLTAKYVIASAKQLIASAKHLIASAKHLIVNCQAPYC